MSDSNNNTIKQIGKICNYYGGLYVKSINEKYYWGIENHDGVEWEEISKELYELLNKHK